jgi:hypothetical protein
VPPALSAQPTPTALASALTLVWHVHQILQALQGLPLPVPVCARQALVAPPVLHALLERSLLVVP